MFKKLSSKAKKFLCWVLAVAMCTTAISSLGAVAVMADPADGEVDAYTVTLEQTDGGTVSFDGIEGDTASFAEGDEVVLSVEPDDGYTFGRITLSGTETGDVFAEDDVADDTTGYTFAMPAEDIFVSAAFVKDGATIKGTDVVGGTLDIKTITNIVSNDITTTNGSNSDIATYSAIPSGVNGGTLPEEVLPNGIGFTLDQSTYVNADIASGYDLVIAENAVGSKALCFTSKGNRNIEKTDGIGLATLYFENVGTVGDEKVDAQMKFTKIISTYADRFSSSTVNNPWGPSGNYDSIFEIKGHWMRGDYGMKETTYTITLTYHDANGDHEAGDVISNVPAWICIDDLDTTDNAITSFRNDPVDYHESAIFNTGDYDAFYIWSDCYLNITKSGNNVTFAAPDKSVVHDTDGDASFFESGMIAATTTASFTLTSIVAAGAGNQPNVYVGLPDAPVKSITSSQSTYQKGDTVSFKITQNIPEFYEDTYECYRSMEITDDLPSGLSLVTNSVTASYMDQYGNQITDYSDLGYFDNNNNSIRFIFYENWLQDRTNYNEVQSITITFDATVTSDITNGASTTLINTANTITNGVTYESNPVDVSVISPKLKIYKSKSKQTADEGESFYYTIQVSQTTKGATAKNIIITDDVPSNLTVNNITTDKGTLDWSPGSNSFTVTKDTLDYNETITITVSVHVISYPDDPDNMYIENTAYANADDCNEVHSTTRISPNEDGFTATKTTDKGTYYVGEEIIYTITANITSDIEITKLYDYLPDNVSFKSFDGIYIDDHSARESSYEVRQNGNEIIIYFQNFYVYTGSTLTLVYTCTADSAGDNVVNSAVLNNVHLYAPVDILEIPPELEISKTADKDTYSADDTVTYTVNLTQTVESATAREVYLTDIIPDGLTNLNQTTLTGVDGTVYDGKNLSVYIPEMNCGDTASITIKARVNESAVGTSIKNTATATAENADEVSDDVTVSVPEPDPGLRISKDADSTEYNIGDTVTYIIMVNQTVQYGTARNVVVSDTLPDGLSLVDVTASGGTVSKNGNSFTVTYGSMSYNSQNMITVTATATAPGTLKNTATAKADNADQVSDDETITVNENTPILTINKIADKTSYSVGDTVTYTIKINQTVAGATATNVVVSDTLPSQLSLIDATASGGTVSKGSNNFTVTYDSIGYNDEKTITVTATATSSGDSIKNTATAKGDNTIEVSDDATVTVLQPVLSVEKKADATTHNVGETVIYTITVKQTTANATAKNVVISDTLPSQLELIDATTSSGAVSKSNNGFTVTIGDMTDLDTVTITVTATAKTAGNDIKNTATAKGDNTDEASDEEDITVLAPSLSITKTADNTVYNVGDTITYTIVVSQTVSGATAKNVVVTDDIPAGLTISGEPTITSNVSGATVSASGNSITAHIGNMTSSDTVTITVKAIVGSSFAGGSISNTATATDEEGDEEKSTFTVTVLKPAISIEKNVSPGPYNVGDTITYTLTVKETMADAVDTDITVTDVVPDELTIVGTPTISGVDGNVSVGTDEKTVTVAIPTLNYDETATITITAVINEDTYGDTIKNIATAQDPYNDPVQDEEDITVATPSVSITKTSDKETYDVGDTITYTITVKETVNGAIAYDLEVTDTLPAGLTLIENPTLSGANGNITVDGQNITATIGKLEYNQTATITIKATVGESLVGKEFTNYAVVEGPGIIPQDDEVTDEVLEPDVSIVKSVSDGTYNVGDVITYTLAVTQTTEGAHTTDVVVTDVIPDGLTVSGKPEITGVDGTVNVDGQTVTANIPTLNYGETAVITIDAEIGSSLAGGTAHNVATVTDTYGNEDEDTKDIDVIHPGLSIVKSVATEGPYNVGDTVWYKIVVTDPVTDSVTYEVEIEDDLPDGLTATGTATIEGVEGAEIHMDGNNYAATAPVLHNGEEITIMVETTIDASAAGATLKNDSWTDDMYHDFQTANAIIEVLKPELYINKTSDNTTYSVSDTVTYTLTANVGPAGVIARNVQVKDTLPDELKLIDVETDMGKASMSGNTLTVDIEKMEATDTVTITVTAQAIAESEGIENVATITADYTDPKEDDRDITVRRPGLNIYKTADAEEYYAGDTVTYTITTVQEVEDATAYNVIVTDTVPDALELTDVSAPGGTVSIDGNSFTVTYDRMDYNDTNVITVTAVAKDVGNETIRNVVIVSSDTTDPVEDYEEVDIIKPVLDIEKNVDDTIHSVGEDVTYTIDVTQTVPGFVTDNVVVTDTLPDELELVGAVLTGVDGDVAMSGNDITATIPKLDYGEVATITVTAKAVAPLDGVKNVAVVTADHADPEEDEVTHDILQPVLDIEKTADAASYNVGDTVTYTICAKQTTENAVAYNVIVSDTLPDGLELIDVATSGVDGVVDIGGKADTAPEDDVDADDETAVSSSDSTENSFTVTYNELSDTAAYITVTALVTGDVADDTITNIATISADNAEPTEDGADIYVMQPVLNIEKTANKKKYFVGDTATYTITVAQTTENATAYDVVVEDTLPDGLKLTDVTAEDADETAVSGNSLSVSYNELSDSRSITVTAEVLEDIANSTANNIATVSASNADSADDDVDIYVMQPELAVDKTSDKETYDTGETATFTIKIAQTVEDAVEENVVMTDTLPDGLTITGTPEITGVEGGISVDGNTVTASIPELAYGEDATVTIQATVGDKLAGKSVTNTVYVSGDHTDEISDDATIKVNEPETVASPNDPDDPDVTGAIGPKTGQSMAGIIAAVICGSALATIVIMIRRRRRI